MLEFFKDFAGLFAKPPTQEELALAKQKLKESVREDLDKMPWSFYVSKRLSTKDWIVFHSLLRDLDIVWDKDAVNNELYVRKTQRDFSKEEMIPLKFDDQEKVKEILKKIISDDEEQDKKIKIQSENEAAYSILKKFK